MQGNGVYKSAKSSLDPRFPRNLTVKPKHKDTVRISSGLSSFLMTNAPEKAYWRRYQNTTSLEKYKGPNGYSIKFLNDPPDWYTTALPSFDPYIFMRKTRPPKSIRDKATTPFNRGDVFRKFKDNARLPPLAEINGYNIVERPETDSWSARYISIASGGSDTRVGLSSSSGRRRELTEILLEANRKYCDTKLCKRVNKFNESMRSFTKDPSDNNFKASPSQMRRKLPRLRSSSLI